MMGIFKIGVRKKNAVAMMLGLFLIAGSACSSRPSSPPTTKEEFIAFFTRAYETGDVKSLEGLIKCDGIEEVRQAGLKNLTFFAGKAKIVATKCEDYDPRFIADRVEKNPKLKFDIQPMYWFTFEGEGNHVQFRYEIALGYEKGRLYICGPYADYKNAEEWQKSVEKEFEAKGLKAKVH